MEDLEVDILTEVTADLIVAMFREQGYSAERLTLQSGKPYVRFKVEGFNSSIYFYQAVDGKPDHFRSIQFSASFKDKLSMEKANQWNKERRFIKVYSDSDGELSFDLDIDFSGGVTRAFILERIGDWRSVFPRVLAFVSQ